MELNMKSIGGRACCIYEYGEPEAILIQPVDDHDLSVLDNEIEHIADLAGGKGFILAAFKINDWNHELAPWPAPAVFGDDPDVVLSMRKYIQETRRLLFEINNVWHEDTNEIAELFAKITAKVIRSIE